MSKEEEYKAATKELQGVYLDISNYYKRMSRASDEHSWSIIQSAIDHREQEADKLREKCEDLRKQYLSFWEEQKKNIKGETNHGLGVGGFK